VNRWILGARPRTLPAAVVPVAVGAAIAVGEGSAAWWRVGPALVVSLALQIGVNYANDYSDGVRGTDDVRVGPARLVAGGLAPAKAVKRAALLSFLVAAVAGGVLAIVVGPELLPVGVAAIAAAWFYTGGPKPYGYLGLGEVFVFTFFGLVATAGTTYVVVEHLPAVGLVAGSGVGFLACALLAVNNLRDIPTDRVSGKRTLAVRFGDAGARWFYGVLVLGAFVAVGACSAWRPWALVGLVALPLAWPPVRTVRRGATGRDLIAALAGTGRLQLAYGLAFAVGLAVGG
jgi:1,4-dihydroxy-2-naphthoate octaprenyltransferase